MNTLHEQPPLKGGRTNWNRMGNTPVVSLAVDTVSRLRRLSGPSDWLWRALPRFVIGSHWNRFAFPVCVITLSSRFSIVGPTILGRNRSIFRVGNVFFFQRLVLVFFFCWLPKHSSSLSSGSFQRFILDKRRLTGTRNRSPVRPFFLLFFYLFPLDGIHREEAKQQQQKKQKKRNEIKKQTKNKHARALVFAAKRVEKKTK